MAKTFLITLDPTTSPGPFNIYYNTTSSDSLIAASPSNSNKSSLLSGVYVIVSDDVKSIFLENIATGCGNLKEINVEPPTPTPTPTATPTATATNCTEYSVVPDAGELAASDDGFIYFSFDNCSGTPTTTSLNSPATFCVQNLSTLFLFYYVSGNPTQCVNSTYSNTTVPC